MLPTTTFELITPDLAQSLLNLNRRNRTIRRGRIEEYKRAMACNVWTLNGESIKISEDNVLLDGQHRLIACVETATPFKTLVVRGLAPESFETIDIGAARTPGDILKTKGELNTTSLGAAINEVWMYKQGTIPSRDRMPRHALYDFFEEHIELRASTEYCASKARRLIAPGTLIAYHYLFSRVNKPLADRLVSTLGTGAGLSERDPVFLLRERLLQSALTNRSSKNRGVSQIVKTALLIKTFNYLYEGAELKILRWGTAEHFPEILGLPPCAV